MNFVCQERLHWASSSDEQITPRNLRPFADADDYKILRNDWPYGIEPDVAHLVVWLKTPFKVDKEGHILPQSREVIREFVKRTFVEELAEEYGDAEERVLWFKNWSALQSVGALEHFHIFVKGVGEELLRKWTEEGPRMMM